MRGGGEGGEGGVRVGGGGVREATGNSVIFFSLTLKVNGGSAKVRIGERVGGGGERLGHFIRARICRPFMEPRIDSQPQGR